MTMTARGSNERSHESSGLPGPTDPTTSPVKTGKHKFFNPLTFEQGHQRLRVLIFIQILMPVVAFYWVFYGIYTLDYEGADSRDVADAIALTVKADSSQSGVIENQLFRVKPGEGTKETPLEQFLKSGGSLADPRTQTLTKRSTGSKIPDSSHKWVIQEAQSVDVTLPEVVITKDLQEGSLKTSIIVATDLDTTRTPFDWQKVATAEMPTQFTERIEAGADIPVMEFEIPFQAYRLHAEIDDSGSLKIKLQKPSVLVVKLRAKDEISSDAIRLAYSHIEEWGNEQTVTEGQTVTSSVHQLKIRVEDLATPLPFVPRASSFMFFIVALICMAVGMFCFFFYMWLRYWVMIRNVRQTQGLPPPFFGSMKEYRGW